MINAGIQSLHVVADFDRTLTHPNSETSWSALKESKVLSEKFYQESTKLFETYHPIEIDHTLSIETRYKAMDDWWDSAHIALLEENVTEKDFVKMAALCRESMYFRNETEEVFELLYELAVPILVFSAGLGDIIDKVLEDRKLSMSNVHVLSNHLVFDGADGIATRFKHSNIHTFSKSEVILDDVHEDYAEEIKDRRNVLLLGDSIGDRGMVQEDSNHDTILRIGFLNNEHDEEALKHYKEAFDVVLENEPSMHFVHELIKEIRGH